MPRSPWRRIPLASIASELTVRIARSSFANLRRLDTSHGCQDHTVLPYAASSAKNFNQPSAGQPKIWRKRLSAVRLRAMFAHGSPPCEHVHAPDAAASTATRPNVRDDGQRPSSRDGMAGVVEVIWGGGEAGYFCVRGWTGQITLKRLKKIASSRRNYGRQKPCRRGHTTTTVRTRKPLMSAIVEMSVKCHRNTRNSFDLAKWRCDQLHRAAPTLFLNPE
jgi:hypothetical protein